MLYRRGGVWWWKFRFAGQLFQESARTTSTTVARAAELKRRRDLEEGANGLRKRTRPRMPGINLGELVSALRTVRPGITLVGNSAVAGAGEFAAAGVERFLPKGWDVRQLIRPHRVAEWAAVRFRMSINPSEPGLNLRSSASSALVHRTPGAGADRTVDGDRRWERPQPCLIFRSSQTTRTSGSGSTLEACRIPTDYAAFTRPRDSPFHNVSNPVGDANFCGTSPPTSFVSVPVPWKV
jgi:hypothetical protein